MGTPSPKAHSIDLKCAGFTVLELIIVVMVIGVIVVALTPRMQAYLVAGKVEPTAKEINAAVAKAKMAFTRGGSSAFYQAFDIVAFAAIARPIANALLVEGTGSDVKIKHRIGAPVALLTVNAVSNAGLWNQFTITLSDVNDAACFIGTEFTRTAARISLNGATLMNGEGTAYDAAAAELACRPGDINVVDVTFGNR